MRFLYQKVRAQKGNKIKISVSQPTRVLVMNNKNYKRYKNNQTFTYFGGEKDGTYEFTAPLSIDWNVVVEKGTFHSPASVTASIAIERTTADPDAGKKKKKKKKKNKKLATSLDEADAALDAETATESEAASDPEPEEGEDKVEE